MEVHKAHLRSTSAASAIIARVWDSLNIVVTPRRLHLFELFDQDLIPPALRRCFQSLLAWSWTHKLPLVQWQTPAQQVSRVVMRILEELERDEPTGCQFTILDFCSGGGGPIESMEKHINQDRKREQKSPVSFVLSDLYPSLDNWIPLAESSAHIKFIPQPVDALRPSRAASDRVVSHSRFDSASQAKHKVIHLYCLCFHHFTDPEAHQILKNTTETADGFAILEMQERRVSSLVLILLFFWAVYLSVLLGFWDSPYHLLFTFGIPLLPVMICFDGLVSCMRTRTSPELMHLARVSQAKNGDVNGGPTLKGTEAGAANSTSDLSSKGQWIFESTREMHTFPIGYMLSFVGMKYQ